jgi:aspartate-semialdehyde dehydrogenase
MGRLEGSRPNLSERDIRSIAAEESRENIGPRIEVGVLGATGAVGQRFLALLENHPWFKVTDLYASERSAGKPFQEAASWRVSADIPQSIANLEVRTVMPGNGSRLIFSAASAPEIHEMEEQLARAGHIVVSNASAHRMDSDVPLLIPEVNPEHVQLIYDQRTNRGTNGYIVTNPNCSTVGLAMVLKPLHDEFGIRAVNVTTMQALSGDGYPGVASLDALDNIVPYIGHEEEKMETEPLKLLGTYEGGKVKTARIKIDAQCNRVDVRDGHMETASITFKDKPRPEEVITALSSFRATPQDLDLPSAPKQPIVYRWEQDRPQPVLDRDTGKGMAVVVGRVRESNTAHIKMVLLSHNTIRGAAGGLYQFHSFIVVSHKSWSMSRLYNLLPLPQ